MASEVEADSPVMTNYSRLIPEDVLEDLCSRFLINIPHEERRDVVRLCFQIELAHWFYIDFYRQGNPELPGIGIKEFTRIVFYKFPFLNETGENADQIFANWRKYKLKVPVFGAILINEAFDKCILVQPAMSKTSWGFPKGKVNKDESEFDCAIREVLEETGFDMRYLADPHDYIEHKIHDHPIRLYVVPGVPENTQFQPQTRGEIRDIKWFEIQYLPVHKKDTNCVENLNCNPSAFFMVIPFVKDLRKRMAAQFNPQPASRNARTKSESMSSPKSQLQKLLDKEDARLEEEKRQATIERRRKLQQEKFLAQHAMEHPLREHHHKEQERQRIARGYQSPVKDRGSPHYRSSPGPREQDEKTTPVKILQRPDRTSPRKQESRDRKSRNQQRPLSPDPLQKLLEGKLEVSKRTETSGPFSPIYHAPMSPYGTNPALPTTRYPNSMSGTRIFDPSGSNEMDPLLKLRLLSAASTHTPMAATAGQDDSSRCGDNRFVFNAPAFLNFQFDRQVFLDILKDSF